METPAIQATTTPAAPKAKRQVRTRLFVHYREDDGTEGLTPGFESMRDLDAWIASTNVRPISVIRGIEKKFKTSVTLA